MYEIFNVHKNIELYMDKMIHIRREWLPDKYNQLAGFQFSEFSKHTDFQWIASKNQS